jgi:prepilin-type processing-associated H-X9-DG protein
VHHFSDSYNQLPPGYFSNNPGRDDSTWCRISSPATVRGPFGSLPPGLLQGAPWTVLILPYIEQSSLYEQFDFTVPFSDVSGFLLPPNDQVAIPLKAFKCPSDDRSGLATRTIELHKWNNYFGVQGGGAQPDCSNTSCTGVGRRSFYVSGMLFAGSKLAFAGALDGTSNVFLLGETRYSVFAWAVSGKQDPCAFCTNLAGAQDPINALPDPGELHASSGFSSRHPGGAHFAMVDGSVHFVQETISLELYRQLGRRSDGLPAGGLLK